MAHLAEVFRTVRREYARQRHAEEPRLPEIDPESDQYLDQLFDWCDAYIRECGISEEALHTAKKRAKKLAQKLGGETRQ